MSNISKARAVFARGEFTCVLCKDDIEHTSQKRGVEPLIELIDSQTDLKGYSAADKVVGKASAMLFVLLGVDEVYSPVMSKEALRIFNKFGVQAYFDSLTDVIINRSGTGQCPMEIAVKDVEDPNAAKEAICTALEAMRSEPKQNTR